MRVRTFELVNEKGQVFSLMDIKEGCIFKEPSGLGYSYESTFERIGNTFIETLRRLNQSNISGNLEFKNYDNYRKYIDFIEASSQIKWKCVIPYFSGQKTFFKDVSFQSIDKTDIFTEEDKLVVPVSFNGLNLWYEENTIVYDMQHQVGEMRWDFKWDPIFRDYNARKLDFINSGHVEAPIIVEIKGPIKNPSLELTVEGKLYQTLHFNIELEEFEKLLYSSKENEFYIQKENTDGTKESAFNLDVLDFDENPIIRFPKNKSCTLKIKSETDITNATVTVLVFYKAI